MTEAINQAQNQVGCSNNKENIFPMEKYVKSGNMQIINHRLQLPCISLGLHQIRCFHNAI